MSDETTPIYDSVEADQAEQDAPEGDETQEAEQVPADDSDDE